jgi:hypothetical protein
MASGLTTKAGEAIRYPKRGAEVEYEVRESEKSPGKLEAFNLTGPNGSECEGWKPAGSIAESKPAAASK